jgi:uncharacterized membrane protein YbhN (UPF0104 family)
LQKKILIAVKLIILGLIIAWIIRTFDTSKWNDFVAQPKNWFGLALSFAVVLLAHVVCFFRWADFVHALGVPFSITEAVRLGFLGTLFNLFLPGAVGGDLFKAIIAAKQAPGKRPEVVASILVDRALGLLGLLIVAAISLWGFGYSLSPTLDWIRRGVSCLVAVGLVSLALIVFIGHRLPMHLLKRLPVVGRLAYRMAMAGMLFEGRPGLVLRLLGMSCVVHALLTLGIIVISGSLYSSPPGISDHFLVIPPAFAAATLPISPGGVGVQEVLVDTLFKELPNLNAEYSGLIVAFVYRAELIAMAAIGGLFYIFASKEEKDLASHVEEDIETAAE